MKSRRDLIVANLAALFLLLVVLLIGWWQEALFGLAVLGLLDLMVLLRGRQAHTEDGTTVEDESLRQEGGEDE